MGPPERRQQRLESQGARELKRPHGVRTCGSCYAIVVSAAGSCRGTRRVVGADSERKIAQEGLDTRVVAACRCHVRVVPV